MKRKHSRIIGLLLLPVVALVFLVGWILYWIGDKEHARARHIVIHSIGLSSLGGALFLQSIVFTSILTRGYFQGIEQNSSILFFEIALTVFAMVYFAYIYANFIISNRVRGQVT